MGSGWESCLGDIFLNRNSTLIGIAWVKQGDREFFKIDFVGMDWSQFIQSSGSDSMYSTTSEKVTFLALSDFGIGIESSSTVLSRSISSLLQFSVATCCPVFIKGARCEGLGEVFIPLRGFWVSSALCRPPLSGLFTVFPFARAADVFFDLVLEYFPVAMSLAPASKYGTCGNCVPLGVLVSLDVYEIQYVSGSLLIEVRDKTPLWFCVSTIAEDSLSSSYDILFLTWSLEDCSPLIGGRGSLSFRGPFWMAGILEDISSSRFCLNDFQCWHMEPMSSPAALTGTVPESPLGVWVREENSVNSLVLTPVRNIFCSSLTEFVFFNLLSFAALLFELVALEFLFSEPVFSIFAFLPFIGLCVFNDLWEGFLSEYEHFDSLLVVQLAAVLVFFGLFFIIWVCFMTLQSTSSAAAFSVVPFWTIIEFFDNFNTLALLVLSKERQSVFFLPLAIDTNGVM